MKKIIATFAIAGLLVVGGCSNIETMSYEAEFTEQKAIKSEAMTPKLRSYREEMTDKQLVTLYKALKNSRDTITFWQYAPSHADKEWVRENLKHDFKCFNTRFGGELNVIKDKTNGEWNRYKEINEHGIKQPTVKGYWAVILDIRNIYKEAINFMEQEEIPYSHRIAAGTKIEQCRDKFDRYLTLLYSYKITP